MISIVIISVVFSWLVLAVIYTARQTTSTQPALHLFQDMDKQPRFGPQGYTALFQDRRQMRPPVPGTVARGQLRLDDHYYRGFELREDAQSGQVQTVYFHGFPSKLDITDRLMFTGRQAYDNYCYPCHGKDGYGGGPVDIRAQSLMALDPMANSWVQAQNINNRNEDGTLVYGPLHYPEGKMYDTIVNGRGNMAGYGHMLSVEQRWAIVVYVQALQMSQVGRDAFERELRAAALERSDATTTTP